MPIYNDGISELRGGIAGECENIKEDISYGPLTVTSLVDTGTLHVDGAATFDNDVTISAGKQLKLYRDDGTDWAILEATSSAQLQLSFNGVVYLQSAGGINSLFPAVDDATDLGQSSYRWKNAFLSGTLHTDGAATLASIVCEGLCDLSGASAGQVKFPASQNASADANTLDDYEEGSFDAAFTSAGGTVTISSSYNRLSYTKVGRAVTVCGAVQISSISSPTGELRLTGLPFTNQTGTEGSALTNVSLTACNIDTTVGEIMIGFIDSAKNYITFYVTDTAGGVLDVNAAPYVKEASTFYINVTYFV
jgi:hypothetical protein